MAGISGNQAYVGVGVQVAGKGVSADIAFKNPFTGGNFQPVKAMEHLSETDSNRDQGVTYVQKLSSAGAPEMYVRDDSLVAYAVGVLGEIDTDDNNPNYVHEITPGNSLPYLTLYRNVGPDLFEKAIDCVVNSLTIKAEAGQPLKVTANIMGGNMVLDDEDPDDTLDITAAAPYYYMEGAITLGGGATSLVKSFEVTVENNVVEQLTDDYVPYDHAPGKREVSVSFDMIFEDLSQYNKFHYGAAVDNAVAASYTTALAGSNNDLIFTAQTPGTGGNSITIRYVDPSANDQVLSVGVVGNAITVNLATGGGGAITTTANDIIAEIEESVAASALVSVTQAGALGSGVVTALAVQNLANGANTGSTLVYPQEQTTDIFEDSASFVFTKGADNSITFDFPRLAYEEFPIEPNPAGDPIVVSARATAQRSTDPDDDPVTTWTIANQTAGTVYSA
jgi:hypothetical protein